MDVYTAAEMRIAGFSRSELSRAVAAGDVLRIRRDRYTSPDSDAATLEAIRIGGVLGCVSALRDYGVWVAERGPLHVHLAPNASRLRPGTAVRHWDPLVIEASRTSVSVLDALIAAVRCQPPLAAIAALGSALNQGLVRRSQLVPHLSSPHSRELLALADGRAESGLETYIRVPLVRLGLRVIPQVRVTGRGRSDLLVEHCVLAESDGAEFHSGPRRHVDHLRDTAAACSGLTPLRYDSAQILHELAPVLHSIIEAVAHHRSCTISGRRLASIRSRVGWAMWA